MNHRSAGWLFAGIFVVMGGASAANGQDFFIRGSGAVAFEPEIALAISGTRMPVSATVSHDRKYVTMTAQPAQRAILGFNTFRVGGDGDVPDGMEAPGIPQPTDPNTVPRAESRDARKPKIVETSPARIASKTSDNPLMRTGMQRLTTR